MGRIPRIRRLASDVFLGIAVGLLVYQGLTGLLGQVAQMRARDAFEVAVASVGTSPRQDTGAEVFDFTDWEVEDAAYWRALRDGEPFGRLVIDAIPVDVVVVKGVDRGSLRKGPGYAPYTDLPGPTGNCGISGHRTTFGAPFRHLDRVRAGDTIELYSPFRRYVYTVERSFTVTPDRVDVFATTQEPRLTLTACHPPYSARLRLVVSARLVGVERLVPDVKE